MAKINLISSQAVTAMEVFVKAEREAGRKVNRGGLLIGLGYAPEEITEVLKGVVSAVVESGEATGIKLVRREGVVPSDYRNGKDVRKEQIEKNKAERAEKKQLVAAEKEAAKTKRLQDKAEREAAKLIEQENKKKAADVATSTSTDTSVAA